MEKKELKKELVLDTHMRALEIMFRLILNGNRLKRHTSELLKSIQHLRAAPAILKSSPKLYDRIVLLEKIVRDNEAELIETTQMMEEVRPNMHPHDQLFFYVCEN